MKKIIIVAVVVVIFLLGAGALVGWFGSPDPAKADSGVTACQDMVARQASGRMSSSGAMTEESYKKARTPWENSSHADLKVAGTNFVDVVWDSQKALDSEDTDIGTSFGILTKLEAKYASLQIACQDHGVVLKPL